MARTAVAETTNRGEKHRGKTTEVRTSVARNTVARNTVARNTVVRNTCLLYTSRIIMPQAIKNILPTYANEFIVMVKETAVAGYIAIEDLTKAGDRIRGSTYEAVLPLLAVALIYLLINWPLSKLFKRIEERMRKSDTR